MPGQVRVTQQPTLWTLCAAVALALVCLGSVGLLLPSSGSPSLVAPTSVVLVLPIFVSELWGVVAFAVWPLAFLAWAHPLLTGSGIFPARTFVLWAVLQLLSAVWFAAGWQLGLQYEGATFTWGTLVLSVLLSLGALGLGMSCRRRASFPRNLVAHWLLFAWVVTYAFPYLGETP